MIYLDASALITLISGRPYAAELRDFLAGRPGVVVPRKELLAEVWQQSYGDDQTIDVHLSWLRRKLGETAARPRYLHTLRGVGVKLEPPGAEREPVR